LPSYDLPKELLKRLQDPNIKEEDGILKGLEELRGRYHNSPFCLKACCYGGRNRPKGPCQSLSSLGATPKMWEARETS
jgi:hypothetical protein